MGRRGREPRAVMDPHEPDSALPAGEGVAQHRPAGWFLFSLDFARREGWSKRRRFRRRALRERFTTLAASFLTDLDGIPFLPANNSGGQTGSAELILALSYLDSRPFFLGA